LSLKSAAFRARLLFMAEEKRKFLRFEILIPVEKIRIEGENRPADKGMLESISREGLGLLYEGDFPLKPGNRVDFTVSIPDKNIRSQVSGQMIRSKPRGYYLEIGLKILDMDKAVHSVLLDLGYSRWRARKAGQKLK
jgi:hypothetical protein